MGRLLAALIADCEAVPAAIPAIPAIPAPEPASRIAESQESQGVELASAKDQAARLLAELRRQYLPDHWIGLDHGDVAELAGLSDRQLSAYVAMLADADLRRRGKVPADETAMALCRGCGPIWVHPAVADAAPVVDGWPRLLGCPWCHVRHAGLYVPRPQVTCGECKHVNRDTINPAGGMNSCGANRNPAFPWPSVRHQCNGFSSEGGACLGFPDSQ
ncbi:MAG: hypothetical protein ACYC9P_05580 [Rudaea sp.]